MSSFPLLSRHITRAEWVTENPNSLCFWYFLQRNTVRLVMGHLDPDGVSRRTRKRFIRRTYRCKVVLLRHYCYCIHNYHMIKHKVYDIITFVYDHATHHYATPTKDFHIWFMLVLNYVTIVSLARLIMLYNATAIMIILK